MATTVTQDRVERGLVEITATFTAQNDAVAFQTHRLSTMNIQASGTFGTATLDLQCSNDGVTYASMPTAVSFTAPGVKSVALADLGFKFYRLIALAAAPGGTLTAIVIGTEQR